MYHPMMSLMVSRFVVFLKQFMFRYVNWVFQRHVGVDRIEQELDQYSPDGASIRSDAEVLQCQLQASLAQKCAHCIAVAETLNTIRPTQTARVPYTQPYALPLALTLRTELQCAVPTSEKFTVQLQFQCFWSFASASRPISCEM